MEETKLKEFNEKLQALLKEYDISLSVEEIPAQKKIVVVPNKKDAQKEQ